MNDVPLIAAGALAGFAAAVHGAGGELLVVRKLSLLVGLCFGLPLFLLLREQAVRNGVL